MKDLSAFKFSYPIQARWSDLDALGHVNNAVFITYFEIARAQYMIEACPGWSWHKHMFLIADIQASFKTELRLSATEIEVSVRTTQMGTKSFGLEYAVSSKVEGKTLIHATGTSVQVMFDMGSKKTIPIADWVRTNLENFEAN